MSVSANVASTLKTKLQKARTHLEMKREKDASCDATHDTIPETNKVYMIKSIRGFLSKFIKTSTLDLNHRNYVRNVKVRLREAMKYQYIFLRDEHGDANNIDETWLKRQCDYVMNLTTEELFNLYGLTFHGDAFVNNYLRGTFDPVEFKQYLINIDPANTEDYFPLFFPALRVIAKYGASTIPIILEDSSPPGIINTALSLIGTQVPNSEKYKILVDIGKHFSYERFWISVLEEYAQSVQKIIQNAPATTQPMMLYRGVKSDYYLTNFMKNHKDRIHVGNSFLSTSSAIHVASYFSELETSNCCFIRIFVPKGIRLLAMMGVSSFIDEHEFLLGNRTQFFITKSKTEQWCKDTIKFNMRVTDMVIVA